MDLSLASLLITCVVSDAGPNLTALLDEAKTVVLATAVSFDKGARLGSAPESFIRRNKERYGVFTFRVDELLHGTLAKNAVVRAFGYESAEHRFGGSCWSLGYAIGSSYLLILDARARPFDYPLTPVSTLVRGPDDPWVLEVRQALRQIKRP